MVNGGEERPDFAGAFTSLLCCLLTALPTLGRLVARLLKMAIQGVAETADKSNGAISAGLKYTAAMALARYTWMNSFQIS